MKMREFSERLTTEAAELGFDVGRVDTSRRHNRLPLSYPGGSVFITFPRSTSDHRSFQNARANLRRIARHVGVA